MDNIQVVILCGGSGTRLREETEFRPKPMIQIGGKPMLWHIMKLYSHFGFNEFVLALGYKQEIIKEYFSHYDIINNDIVIDIGHYQGINHLNYADKDWRVILSDTGNNTMKGGRLKRVEKYICGDTFMCTYGDGIGNIDILALLAFHQSHGKLVTITGVHPIPRFGEIYRDDDCVLSFSEKLDDDNYLVNGGFFVFNRRIFNYLTKNEQCDLERGPLELIAAKGEMKVYEHKGFWGCLDTLKDLEALQNIWEKGNAPWRVW